MSFFFSDDNITENTEILRQPPRDVRISVQAPGSSSPMIINDDMKSKENRLTRISLCIVWLFIFCHVWKLIPTLYEGWNSSFNEGYKWPPWVTIINDLSHTLIVFNSAVNFLIYVAL